MTRSARWVLTSLLPALLVSTATAQNRNPSVVVSPEVGVHAGRQFHDDEWIVGGYLRWPVLGIVDIRPGGDIAVSGDHNYQLNGDLALHGPRDLAYIGGGLAWVHRDFGPNKDSGTGLNLFIGFKPVPRPGAQLYLEARWTLVESRSIFRALLGGAWRF